MIQYVDPFIAVNWPGNGLCGPYLPNSLVRLGPDVLPPVDTTGYQSGKPILRFSHTHVSGTGGGGRYGNIGVTPFTGAGRIGLDAYEPVDEQASAGYYSVVLGGVKCELTSTPRVGVHRYTFPAGAGANVLIDAGSVVQVRNNTPGQWTGASIGGFVEWTSDREIIGRADCRGGWGHQYPYSVYFYASFDRPAKSRMVANAAGIIPGRFVDGAHSKAVASFGETSEVCLFVGISYVSIAKARASVEREINGKSFDDVHQLSQKTWSAALSRIRIQSDSTEQKTLFYTLFTRLICMPSDLGIDDEFGYWHSGVRHFTDYYCLWDSVRNANSLIGLFDPKLEADLLNCMLDVADHNGWLPDAWIAGHSAMVQGGSSADILLCEAALKGIEGIDYEKALRQMRKNNEVESPDPWYYGRHLKDWRDLGYLSPRVGNCVSRHLEYAYQDWCIGRLAEHLGQSELAQKNFETSTHVWNLWREDLKSFAPRNVDGSWVKPFDPKHARDDSWNDPYFYEGTSWQWSFNVQHDFAGLVERFGGAEPFMQHLDEFFEKGHYYSKETMLHVPWLYHYAGRPDRTAQRVRWCLDKSFKPTRDGLRDNEDMGCQSAFYMCSTMGLYPIMGQDLYLLSTPHFQRVEIDLGSRDKMLVIEALGAGPDRPYIAKATLNGKPLDRAWLRHAEIAQGGVLRYELSAAPTTWGRASVPPSPMAEPARVTTGGNRPTTAQSAER